MNIYKLTNMITSEDILIKIYKLYRKRYIKEKCELLNLLNKQYFHLHKCISMKYSCKILQYIKMRNKNNKLIDYEFDLLYL
jgi:hypothetical protein